MSGTTAKVLSRTLLGLALVMAAATFLASAAATHHLVTAPIIVGDATVADGPSVLMTIQHEVASGAIHIATGANVANVIGVVLALLWLSTGSLIVARQPRNLAGWLFIAVGLAWVAEALGIALVTWSLVGGQSLPGRDLFAVMGNSSLLPVFLLPLVFLLFPDGRPPSPGWRWSMWVLLTGFAVFILGYALSPGPLNNFVDTGILYVNPIGVRALSKISPVLAGIGGITIALAALSTVPAVRWRYKRSTAEERQQLRWLVAVATLAGALLLALLLTIVVSPESNSGALNNIFTVLFLSIIFTVAIGVPAAYLVAIFRYRLWDLDVVIKKAAVALLLAVLISGIAITFALNVGQFALWKETPKPITILAGIAVGLLFVPLLRLSRKLADRVVFGRRATPYEVLTSFSGRVGETYSTEDVLPRMADVMRSASGAETAAVWLRIGGELREDATSPPSDERRTVSAPGDHLPDLDDEHAVEVRHQGELLGALSVRMAASDPMNPAKDRLMRDLASQAGLVLRNVRLLEELRASRRRIVAAQDERARKLERDLHDGAQQQLVALSIQLRLARSMVDRDATQAGELLDSIQESATAALDDLRDLARGIYPPLLADKGLAAALDAQVRRAAVPTAVDADGVGRYPRQVESAVYFCCLEALNNIAKYASASAANIRLVQANGHLTFEVRDDGTGIDTASTTYGTGLQGMADRLDAVGGSLSVRSALGEGTTVIGSVTAVPEGEVLP